ncbi:hypothetical protein [Vibrio harveyi]
MLRSKTKRYYGHPHTISFIQELAKKMNQD